MSRATKKPAAFKLFASSGLRAIAIVVLTITAGAVVLPQIFADTANPAYSVTNLSATPTNTASYAINLAWQGNTLHHYHIEAINGSTTEVERNTQDKSYALQNLNCNATYTFRVTPVDSGGTKNGSAATVKAKPTCAMANFVALDVSGTKITARWTNANFASTYTVYYKAGNAGFRGVGPNSSSSLDVDNGLCATNYLFYVTATANGQTGPATPTRSAATAACPSPTPSPNPTPTPAPTPSGPTRSGGSSSSGGTRNTTPATVTPTVSTAPSTPVNLIATIASNKIVELSWDIADNADHYILSRSTDQLNWTQIAEPSTTSYTDESADFSTTYYYQLQAVSEDGQISAAATAEATTEAFEASSQKIVSDDKKVTVTIPDGSIDGDYSCTLGVDDGTGKTPTGLSSILGPYDLLCVTSDGEVVDEFAVALPVTIKLGDSSKGYKNLSVQLAGDKGWSRVTSISYDQAKQEIGFKLTSSKSFGVFGVKQGSSAWIFIIFFLLLLLIGGFIFFLIRRRRGANSDDYSNYPVSTASPAPEATIIPAAPTAEEEFRQAVAQPDCSHLDQAQQVIPSSQGCLECEQQGTKWSSLRICLICGHVGCSDDSEQQHALKHYQETGHPLIYEYGNPAGNNIGWCYIDQTYI